MSLREALHSGPDLLGERVLAEHGEPSYDAVAPLLPPLGEAAWCPVEGYPILLSLKGCADKVRLASTGAAIDLDVEPVAQADAWHHARTRAAVLVGPYFATFGERPADLVGPHYADGCTPIVQWSYTDDGICYALEVFAAPASERDPQVLCAFVRLSAKAVESGRGVAYLSLRLQRAPERLAHVGDRFIGRGGALYAAFEPDAKVDANPAANVISHRVTLGGDGEVARHFVLPNRPTERVSDLVINADVYANRRAWVTDYWQAELARGAQVTVPEQRVNDACNALRIGSFMIAEGDELRYSAQNVYQRLFGRECGDALTAMAMFGHTEADSYLRRLLRYEFLGNDIGLQEAGFKLQCVARYVHLIGDRAMFDDHRDKLRAMADSITAARAQTDHGLLPPEFHCDDVHVKVHPLSQNANCWRGLRDMANLDAERRDVYATEAENFRGAILDAVAQSTDTTTDPPFVAYQLFGNEKPYPHTTGDYNDVRVGGGWEEAAFGAYYNLMMPYVLGSGVFPPGDERPTWIMRYLEQHGALMAGLIRFDKHGFRTTCHGLDDLYGLRYNLTLIKADRVDRALLSFYGKLAHGLTRDTCIGCETSEVRPQPGPRGRRFDLPPNSASNACYLQTLRGLLVMEHDADDDGLDDELRLLPATPRAWLDDGKRITLERLPTSFGMMHLDVHARLSAGVIDVRFRLDARRKPGRIALRLRLPRGWTAEREWIDIEGNELTASMPCRKQ